MRRHNATATESVITKHRQLAGDLISPYLVRHGPRRDYREAYGASDDSTIDSHPTSSFSIKQSDPLRIQDGENANHLKPAPDDITNLR